MDGWYVPLGYDIDDRQLVVNKEEAETVRMIFGRYLELESVADIQEEIERLGILSKARPNWKVARSGAVMSRGTIYHLLSNPVYIGKTRHKGAIYDGMHEAIVDSETWHRTADLLKANGVARKNRKNLPSGRMLHGKLMTDTGHVYTPTHCSKGGRRYFYYTLVGKHADAGSRVIPRLPAAEIEDRVISTIKSFLEDPLRIADAFSSLDIRETKLLISAARHRATLLDENTAKDRSALISCAVFRIVVAASGLGIELDRKHLCHELTDSRVNTEDSAAIVLNVPYEIARRGNEVRLVLSDESSPIQGPIASIVRAVAQAKTWYEWVINGEIRNMRELAKRAGLDRKYASRIFQLAVLSPQVTEALLNGNHSPSLTVAKLMDVVQLDWDLQKLAAK